MPPSTVATRVFDLPSSHFAELIVRAIESAAEVRRRSQLFVWSQNQLHALLPHQLAVCGAYFRARKDLVLDALYTVPVAPHLLAALSDSQSVLMRRVVALWVEGQGRCKVLNLHAAAKPSDHACFGPLLQAGYSQLLVHGVARPQRLAELESIFVLTAQGTQWTEQHTVFLDLMLPHLHSTYLRVVANEQGLSTVRPAPAIPKARTQASPITERERQILLWVREGMSNHEIGTQLSISALTVKNHVQKILRKLGAANRAQAVAMAISQNLMDAANLHTHENTVTS
jgi:transcriptional regulator EpsA